MKTRILKDCNIADLCIPIVDKSTGSAVEELYLQTKYRVAWFNKWCEENGHNGCIDDSDLQIVGTAPRTFWLSKAVVYIDGQPVARSAAAMPCGENDDWSVPQIVGTYAKGRALSNAGFGTASCGIEDGGNMEAKGYLADAPVPKPASGGGTEKTEFQNPLCPNVTTDQPKPAAPAEQTTAASAPSAKDATKAEPNAGDSPENGEKRADPYERALNVVIPFGGNKGKTLGEVIATNPGYPDWIISHIEGTDDSRKRLFAAAEYIVKHRPAPAG